MYESLEPLSEGGSNCHRNTDLVYLGIKVVFESSHFDPDDGQLPITATLAFRQAVFIEVLNPKTALFFLAFLPQFAVLENGLVASQLAILGAVFASIGFLSTIVYSLAAGGLGAYLSRGSIAARWRGKIVGSIYCAMGVRLAFQER
ncbi:MAG: LysE family translocator [Pseudomonadota bacterium]